MNDGKLNASIPTVAKEAKTTDPQGELLTQVDENNTVIGSIPRGEAAIRAIARQLKLAGNQSIDVDHDCRIALAGGLSGRPGIVLIAGTGSSCYGENAIGESWIAGGWGHLISDEGSSYWLGIQAMRCAAASYDGRIHSILQTLVQDYFQLIEFRELMHRLYVIGMSRSEVASLAPLVITAARQGDEVALDLLDKGAYDLAQMVSAVADKLHFTGHRVNSPWWVVCLMPVMLSPLPCALPFKSNYLAAKLSSLNCRLPAALLCLH